MHDHVANWRRVGVPGVLSRSCLNGALDVVYRNDPEHCEAKRRLRRRTKR